MKKLLLFIFSFSLLVMSVIGASNTSDDPLLLYRQGLDSFQKKKYLEAEQLFRQFIATEPFAYEIREAYYYLAETNRLQKKYTEAIVNYNILKHRYPNNNHMKEIPLKLGQCYFRTGNHVRAEYYFKEYEKVNDSLKAKFAANLYLGEIAEQNRARQDAAAYYRKALLLAEKDPTVANDSLQANLYYRLAKLSWIVSKDHASAFDALKRAFTKGLKRDAEAIFLLREIMFTRFSQENGLPDDAIADIKIDGDDVYIATFGGGLVRYVRSADKFEKIPLPSPQIRSIHVDFDAIFISTFDGIFIHDKKSSLSRPLTGENQEIFQLAQKVIKDDRYLLFTTLTKGVIKYDLYKKTLEILDTNSFIGSSQVYAVAADHRFNAFGTLDHGVILYDKEKKQVIRLSRQNGMLQKDNIKALLLDGRFLWIGVHDSGIYRYDLENASIQFFNWQLPFPTVIAKREREIWIGTSGNGIRIYNRETGTLEKLRGIEGLKSNEIHSLEIDGDFIWIGYLDRGIDRLYRPLPQENR